MFKYAQASVFLCTNLVSQKGDIDPLVWELLYNCSAGNRTYSITNAAKIFKVLKVLGILGIHDKYKRVETLTQVRRDEIIFYDLKEEDSRTPAQEEEHQKVFFEVAVFDRW